MSLFSFFFFDLARRRGDGLTPVTAYDSTIYWVMDGLTPDECLGLKNLERIA